MVNERTIDWSRRDDEREDGTPIESESLRPDRRATARGTAIVAHQTRESFMRATGGGGAPVVTDADRERMPAREVHRAMLRAWEEKYGPVVLATDAEIRAASQFAGGGRYRQ